MNGSLAAGSAVTVQSGATLGGSGTVNGPTTISAGGTLAPGANGLGTNAYTGNLTLAGTLRMELMKSGSARPCDLLVKSGTLTCGGSLVVTNIGTDALVVGDSFALFSAASVAGNFASITLPPLPAGLAWSNQLASATRSIQVIQAVNITPSNLTAVVSSGNLTLSWPPDHTGWRLLAQTNRLASGLSLNTNDWMTVPGSSATNQATFPINPASPGGYYRMAYP